MISFSVGVGFGCAERENAVSAIAKVRTRRSMSVTYVANVAFLRRLVGVKSVKSDRSR